MLRLPKKDLSMLLQISDKTTYPQLKDDIEVDAVIVGGGICGLTCAYLLQQAGQKVALLEKGRIGTGTTGHTTGKVTSQHNLFYADLASRRGIQTARMYGQANNSAIDEVENIINKERIQCGWERADHIIYTTDSKKIQQFKQEAKVASKVGLPVTYETRTDLPFDITAAVRSKDQAHFNAKAYVNGLAAAIVKKDGQIFENSNVDSFHDHDPVVVGTSHGTVTAKNIIVATNVPTFPLLARAAYCVLEYPTTSYLITAKIKAKLGGMYISPDEDNFSLLPISVKKSSEDILLVGGRNHIRGLGRGEPRWRQLADYAEQHFQATEITYKWSAWDYIAYDNIPLVGKLYPWSKHLYVATAFKKWGLSNTMVAAQILRDTILGQPTEWAKTFNSMRTSPIASIPDAIKSYVS
jgi:glycine/D-amino acid oxidase-like deaminating enzyme